MNLDQREIREMALKGAMAERARLDDVIAQLGGGNGRRGRQSVSSFQDEEETPTGRRPLSAAARKRISIAQKKRWKEARKAAK